MSEWPHTSIHAALLQSIRRHAMKQPHWRFTQLEVLHDALARMIQLEPDELCVVSCFIDAQRWYVMTTSRVFGIYRGTRFEFSPLQIRRCTWGDFKQEGRLQIELAEVQLADGARVTLAYEAGFAAIAPIYYERFWHTSYPALAGVERVADKPDRP
ncbi:hypothetical protein JM946_03725 [Steroidobacter sp. S1-65]|uniref:YokE-like PH domain-containing protein n=1 Tax=Steroidobacter gossypii TaxID=2805490 RepID=A0ABS1WS92_9GAMM|nr:hypothetical protein [Steroidobacter gossypii]MBM0103834.1 hypothetical protein [Steroidobacter gossypii]